MFCFIWSNFLFKYFSLSSKSVIFIKAAILFLLAKFACANLASKLCAVNLLNSCLVIELLLWLLWSLSAGFFSILLIFVLYSDFSTKLLTLGISFSTAVRAVAVTKLVILGILLLTLFILASVVVIVTKLVIPGILSSMSLI